jgi:glucokinase
VTIKSGVGAAEKSVVIDIDGAEASFALCNADLSLDVSTLRKYRTSDFPTATDCVQGFGRDLGIKLAGMDCAVAVSGAVSGDSVRIARSPWIISKTGLGYLFQRPVHFLNDSAARLWASTKASTLTHRPVGANTMPDFNKSGRWLGINYNSGLGAALLVSQDGTRFTHVETEAGHCSFAPVNDVERQLVDRLGQSKKPVSWERALFAEANDPAWVGTPVFGDQMQLLRHRAEILGSFAGEMILASGSWQGVALFGQAPTLLNNADNAGLFTKRLEARANFQLQLRSVPCWSVIIPNINLIGAAHFLRHHREANGV